MWCVTVISVGRSLSELWVEFRFNTVPQEGNTLNMYRRNPEENPESHTEGVSSLSTAFITISLLPFHPFSKL
jgi:hypothetical protein